LVGVQVSVVGILVGSGVAVGREEGFEVGIGVGGPPRNTTNAAPSNEA
jgi:hypothetical protein